MPGLRRRAARVRGARGGAHRQWQAVHRPVRQGRGGAVRPDLPRQWHHPPAHRAPASATTGKVERFHGSLRRELLDDAVPFADLAAAQAAIDAWRQQYNTTRPHQALSMASPAERFTSAKDSKAEQLLPLRLPAILSSLPPADANQGRADQGFTHLAWPGALQGAASGDHGASQAAPDHQAKFAGALPPGPSQDTGQSPSPRSVITAARAYDGGPVEFERVVPPSG